MMFNKDDFVITTGRVARVLSVDRRSPVQHASQLDLSRYTIEYEDHTTLHNAPGYLMREATEEEVHDAIRRMSGAKR